MPRGDRLPHELAAKVREYEGWINDTLKRDLAKLYELKARLQAEEKELVELASVLDHTMGSGQPLKTLVELGAGVHCQAKAADTSRVYMAVGLGFHVECTLAEAQRVLAGRRSNVQQRLLKVDHQLAEQKATIKFAVQAISELSGFSS